MNQTRGTDQQKDVALKTGVNASTVSRWLKSGEPGTGENVIAFARAYGVPPLAALVAADLLTPSEARQRPAGRIDASQLTNDELLELVRTRMREEGERDERPAATNGPVSGPGSTGMSVVPPIVDDAVAALDKEGSIVGEQGAEEHP